MPGPGFANGRIVADGQLTSSMAIEAAKRALADAELEAGDIGLIILATSTPDQTFPATAVTIQAELGITEGAAFDVQAVCSGFVFALSTADNYLKSGQFKTGSGGRRRSLLADPRLGGPCDLRAFRRWRRRTRDRSGEVERNSR